MKKALDGKVAAVTGGASGIGLASAETLMFMLTRPRGVTIRDVVILPSNFDL